MEGPIVSQATLIKGAGSRLVTAIELAEYKAPDPVGRWFPLSHATVYERVRDSLVGYGFEIAKQELSVSQDGHKFFGTLRLTSVLSSSVTLAVGVRNSTDKTIPIGMVAGSSVFVCANLAFHSDILVVRKHTRFGADRFSADIEASMPKLRQFREQESERIEAMQHRAITDVEAESVILRAYEHGVVNVHQLSSLLQEWRQPSFEEFRPRTLWSLFNAFTTVMGSGNRSVKQPVRYAQQTMRLNHLVTPLALAA